MTCGLIVPCRLSRPIGGYGDTRVGDKEPPLLSAPQGDAKALIIVAPPRALGVLRHAYSPKLRAALKAEIDKDYVKTPIHEIEKQLFG